MALLNGLTLTVLIILAAVCIPVDARNKLWIDDEEPVLTGNSLNIARIKNPIELKGKLFNKTVGEVPIIGKLKTTSKVAFPYSPVNIGFHGGKTMSKGINVYVVWYGNWPVANIKIIKNFLNSLGSANADEAQSVRKWWRTTGLYYNSAGHHFSTQVVYKKRAFDKYSRGTGVLSTNDIVNIIYKQVVSGNLPKDPQGVYLVLTSKDVVVDGFCTKFCGFHNSFSVPSDPLFSYTFAFIGDSGSQCPQACAAENNLNGDVGVDAMISIIGHELAETVSDPQGTAWYDSNGEEQADKCSWSYGRTYRNSKGQMYNLVGANKKRYLVQELYNPLNGLCTLFG